MIPNLTANYIKRLGVSLLTQIQKCNILLPIMILGSSETIDLANLAIGSMKNITADYILKGSISSKELADKIHVLVSPNRMTENIHNWRRNISADKNQKCHSNIDRWIIDRSLGIMDEVLDGIVLLIIIYIVGVLSRWINWASFKLFPTPKFSLYLLGSTLIMIPIITEYIF